MEVLGQLPVPLGDIMRGVGWGDNPLLSFEDARREAWAKLARFSLGIGDQVSEVESFEHLKEHAMELWCAVFFLALQCQNKGYRPHKSGLFNCQSAVFFLDTVMANFKAMAEDLAKTAEKLKADGKADRSESCHRFGKGFLGLIENISVMRGFINRGL